MKKPCKPLPQPPPACDPELASCRRKVEKVVAACIVKVKPWREPEYEALARDMKDRRAAALTGRCSVAAEAAFYVLGGHKHRKAKLVRTRLKGGGTHWWASARGDEAKRMDPTAAQFPVCELPAIYRSGRGGGMTTPRKGYCHPPPSSRAAPVVACARKKLRSVV